MEEKDNRPRTSRTIRDIRNAFLELAAEQPRREITIAGISRQADINRKTFYRHYDTVDDLIYDLCDHYAEEIIARIERHEPDDLAGAIQEYYTFLDTDDPKIQTLLYGEDYDGFLTELDEAVTGSPFFRHVLAGATGQGRDYLYRGYLKTILDIYLTWRDRRPTTISQLSADAAHLFLHGIK